jgi:phosphoribosyl 1,2-cyclic phosphodiesterase
MLIRFWGVRGSIPAPEKDKLKVGGNTSCVEVEIDDERRLILDAGSGIRALGLKLKKEIAEGKSRNIVILLSHTHWDHIQGFPFFVPALTPGVNITIFGPSRANRTLEKVLAGQMEYDYFPVKFSQLPANLRFHELGEGVHTLWNDLKITIRRHIHPGIAFGYRIEYKGKSLVYSTDTEHFQNMLDSRVVELSKDADLLIHDAQFINEEMEFRLGWGHSTWEQCVNVAKEANVRKLMLFHHDPSRSDEQAFEIERQAKEKFHNVILACEEMEVRL